MKQHQVTKLYRKLTPYEQASLAFEAAMRKDKDEVDLILNSIEQKTYLTGHADYHIRSNGLINLSGIYGIFYWKAISHLLAVARLYDNAKDDNISRAIQLYADEIYSMNIALKVVCKELKIATSAIKTYAECDATQPEFDGQTNDKFIEQYTKLFSKSAGLTNFRCKS